MTPVSDVRKRSIASIRTTTFKVRKRVQKPKLCSEPTGGAGHIRHSPFKRPAMRPAISNSADATPAIFKKRIDQHTAQQIFRGLPGRNAAVACHVCDRGVNVSGAREAVRLAQCFAKHDRGGNGDVQ